MRPLAALAGDHAAVEGMAGKLDQRIRQPLLARPLVVLAGLASQRLKGAPNCGAADRVEDTLKEKAAILEAAHGELALPRRLPLVLGEPIGIGRVPLVLAGLAELAEGELEALSKQPTFVQLAWTAGDRLTGSSDQRQVAESDAALLERR